MVSAPLLAANGGVSGRSQALYFLQQEATQLLGAGGPYLSALPRQKRREGVFLQVNIIMNVAQEHAELMIELFVAQYGLAS